MQANIVLRAQPRLDSKWVGLDPGLVRSNTPSLFIHCSLTMLLFLLPAPYLPHPLSSLLPPPSTLKVFSRDGLSSLWNDLVKDGELTALNNR